MMNYPGMVYTPSKSVTVRKCELKRGRRNNLATNGCEGLLVEDCDIEEAGGDTIGPQLGIDLEGYGENGRKYDHPYELTISDCRFRKMVVVRLLLIQAVKFPSKITTVTMLFHMATVQM